MYTKYFTILDILKCFEAKVEREKYFNEGNKTSSALCAKWK